MTPDELGKTLAAYNVESFNFLGSIFTEDFELTDEVKQKVDAEHKRVYDIVRPLIKQAQALDEEDNSNLIAGVMIQLMSVPDYETIGGLIDTKLEMLGETDEEKEFAGKVSTLMYLSMFVNPDELELMPEEFRKLVDL